MHECGQMKPIHQMSASMIKIEALIAEFNRAKNEGKTNAIPLTNRCIFGYSCHVIVTHKFWCMIIYIANRYIYITYGNKSTIVSLHTRE